MKSGLKILEWDSEYFRITIGTVSLNDVTPETLSTILKEAEQRGVDCLYCLLPAGEKSKIHLVETEGFKGVDTRVTLVRDLSHFKKTIAQSVQAAKKDDHSKVLALSTGSFQHSRFFNDKNFSKNAAEGLYTKWAMKNLNSPHPVFLVKDGNKTAGFISTEIKGSVGKIDLIAVEKNARGKNFGKILVENACEYFRDKGCTSCEVITQAENTSAMRLYQKCGFTTLKVELWFHKWFETKRRTAA